MALTTEEKMSILTSHEKSLDFNKYNLELSVRQENARALIDTQAIARLEIQLDDIEAQRAILQAEIALVMAQTA